jgi:CubicO group peptidase (beta-lactamase class C family)
MPRAFGLTPQWTARTEKDYLSAMILATVALAASLDRAVNEFMAATKTPGMAIAVVQGDQIVYAKGFGTTAVDDGAAVKPDTLFQIGSLTKMFTAATLLALAADGKVDLDAPASRYISGLNEAIGRLTAAQLLSHTSGLKDEPAEYGSHDERDFAEYPRTWPATYAMLPPGTTFSYSNPGYSLAGLIAQQVGGKSFPDLVEERVFKPLGMNRSTFRPTVAMTYPVAIGHRGPRSEPATVVRPIAEDTRHWPAGYVYSSANDLARFAIAFLQGRFAELAKPRAEVANDLEPAQYGYGLFLETYHGVPTVWHAGDMPGFTAMMRIMPAEKLALIVLANRQGLRPDPILDALLDVKPPQTPSQAAIAMRAEEMQSYVGHYSNRFPVDVFIRDGKLFIRRPDGEHGLEKVGEHRFTTDPERKFRPAELEIYPTYLSMWVWAFAKKPMR